MNAFTMSSFRTSGRSLGSLPFRIGFSPKHRSRTDSTIFFRIRVVPSGVTTDVWKAGAYSARMLGLPNSSNDELRLDEAGLRQKIRSVCPLRSEERRVGKECRGQGSQ